MYSYKNLSFYYGKKMIFKDINININNGEVIALVGNNGVGKTTLLNLIKNINEKNFNIKTSYLDNVIPFYNNMTVFDNLYYYSLLSSISKEKIENILNELFITKYKNILYKNLSLGTKQKVNLARCLIEDSEIYLFDEPLNGLDPKSIIIFNNIIKRLKNANKAIIISSHLLNEINTIADKYLYLNHQSINNYNKNELEKLKEKIIGDTSD